MIKTIAINDEMEVVKDVSLSELISENYLWYWVDFDHSTKDEIKLLKNPFNFHHLAIEDCAHNLQRPKLDYYEGYTFFITQALNPKTLSREEVNFFLGEKFIVTFHHKSSPEIEEVWQRLCTSKSVEKWTPSLVLYYVLDSIVDNYFPLVHHLEDTINEIDANSSKRKMEFLLKSLFELRQDLIILSQTVGSMRDLTYRMVNSHRLTGIQDKKEYFSDIYDHLLKIAGYVTGKP